MSDGVIIYDCFDLKSIDEFAYRIGTKWFDAREVLNDNEQKIKSGTAVLRVKNDATHSGQPINGRLYPFTAVKKGARTWLADYPKPVLKHHRSGSGFLAPPAEDPIGRVRAYRFQPLVPPNAQDSEIDNRILPSGTGVLQLESDITDPDAIQKIMDGRFTTTSIGFRTDSMCCTVCGSDWKQKNICEHEPNRVYESPTTRDGRKTKKVLCLLKCDGVQYHEQSFVNVPADKGASVTSFEMINDALESAFRKQDYSAPVCNFLIDSLVVDGVNYSVHPASDKEVIELSTQTTSDGTNSEPIPEVEWVTQDKLPSEEEDQAKPESAAAAPTEDEEGDLNDDEFAYAHVLKSMRDNGMIDYEAMEKEDGLSKNDIDVIIKEFEDAKLSTSQRKKLKSSSFCGPDRSFPANDCAHVRAGFRLLNRAKVSDSTRASIRSCLNRKNNSMGCGVSTSKTSKNSEESQDTSADTKVEETASTETQDQADQTTEQEVQDQQEESKDPTVEALQDQIASLKQRLTDLTDENAKLASKVQKNLAQRLVDLRVRNNHPSVKQLDEENLQSLVDSLTERSTASLEDAIVDEEKWGKRSFPIARGEVTSPAYVDRSTDEQSKGEGSEADVRPQNYQQRVAAAFPGRGD